MRVTEFSRPRKTIVHISDTHLLAGKQQLWDTVDSESLILRLLFDLSESGIRPDAIVFTGDLADAGEPEAYRRLRELTEPVAEKLGAKIVWLPGNHDDRTAFRTNLLDEEPSTDPLDSVHWLGDLRFIALDSTVPGHHFGELTKKQLAWLAAELATPAPMGTIIGMHHPPAPGFIDLTVTSELRDQAKFADVIRGTDVRSIIAGHLHHPMSTTFAGIPVSVASATCYTQDLILDYRGAAPQDGGQAFNIVHVYDDIIAHTVIPSKAGKTIELTTAEVSEGILAKYGYRFRD